MNILVKANKSFDVENMFQSNAAISLFRFSKNGGMMSYINSKKYIIEEYVIKFKDVDK